MNSRDLLAMSARNLWRRKLRTSLTLLGVLIGTTSIIVMVSLGLGLNQSTMQSMERMGSLTTINVSSNTMTSGMTMATGGQGGAVDTKKTAYLNDKALEDFKKIPGVVASEPIKRADFWSPLKIGKNTYYMQYVGVREGFFKAFELEPTQGLAPSIRSKTKPPIYLPSNLSNFNNNMHMMNGMTATMVEEDYLKSRVNIEFTTWDPLTSKEKVLKSIRLSPVGLYKNTGWEPNAYLLMEDLEYLNSEYKKSQESQNKENVNTSSSSSTKNKNKDIYSEIRVKVNDISNVADVKAQIESMGYYGNSMMDMVNEMNKQMATIQAVLAGIGSVALLVAAIGITNTMVMSIYERTREIGVMKVIGASVKNIRRMFLTEAIMIGVFGGALGVLLSLLISKLINQLLGPAMSGMTMPDPEAAAPQISYIPIWLILLAVIFSGFIGLLAGYFPAKRATKLSAIEAIKTD